MHVTRRVSEVLALLMIASAPIGAQTRFEVLHAFDPTLAPLSGNAPSAPPVAWFGGLYGTTMAGGAFDQGTVYRLTSSGLQTIHHFNGADGAHPVGVLAVGVDGRLYGTTYQGGSEDRGTIFRISVLGALETIHSFTSTEGRNPSAGVVLARDGLFWGTTTFGGTHDAGTAFKISHGAAFTQVRSFGDSFATEPVLYPHAPIIQASDGNFYGTTYGSTRDYGGSVYRLTPAGEMTTGLVFHTFEVLGAAPRVLAGLVEGTDGWLYGGACCGATSNLGGAMPSIFRLDRSFTEYQDVYPTTRTNPVEIQSSLVVGSDGLVYGASGPKLFSVDATGNLTTYKEMAETDGRLVSGMRLIAPGWFIGTAYAGGAGGGTIFLFRPY